MGLSWIMMFFVYNYHFESDIKIMVRFVFAAVSKITVIVYKKRPLC